jgi:uncharacterized membrane protein
MMERAAMRWIMAAFYAVAGVGHLLRPEAFLPIVPDWVPFPRDVILATGVCELAGVAALLTVRLRWIAGLMLALSRCASGPPTSSTRSRAFTCRRFRTAAGITGHGWRCSRF